MAVIDYWTDRLVDTEPCLIPETDDCEPSEPFSSTTKVSFSGTFNEDAILTVWALVLRYYAGCNSICFGHVKDFSSVFIHQLHITKDLELQEVSQHLRRAPGDGKSENWLPLQSLKHVFEALGGACFNTLVYIGEDNLLEKADLNASSHQEYMISC
jgi:hypothetical protein